MKKILFPILIILQVSCKYQYFKEVNKTLNTDYPQKSNRTITSAFDVRKKISELGFLSFITEKDTIYFLDSYDLPTATHYGSIWTSSKSFHYSFSNETVAELSISPIKSEMITLVTKWDTATIKKQSEINYNRLNPNYYMTAYQVYKNKKHITTNKITFKPFY